MIAPHLLPPPAIELAVGYVLALSGLAAGLLARRAPAIRLLAAPLVAAPLVLAGEVLARMLPAWTGGLARDPGPARSLLAVALAALAGFLMGAFSRPGAREERVKRGARIAPARSRLGFRGGRLSVAGQALAPGDEARHLKVIGTTGTGKTTAIGGLLASALARGDDAVIADPDGSYLATFYDRARGDRILNPFDARTDGWDIFGELATAFDADHIARALIADHAGEDRNWRSYARTLVAATLRRLHRAGIRDVGTLQRLLLHAPTAELTRLLDGSAAAPFLTEENSRFFASVRAIAANHLAILEHLGQPAGGTPLSVRAWIRGRPRSAVPAVLFLPYRAGQIATLKGAVSAWLRLAIFETLDSGGPDRPIWFVADELDAIGAIDGLKDALARLRKAGGRCVLGFQSIAQVTGTYGSHDAQTIIENCGNTLILRCSSSGHDGTAEFASRLIGEREVFRRQVTRSRRGAFGEAQPSHAVVEHLVAERAVLPVELEQLPDFTGFLKFASAAEWRRVDMADR